MQKVGALQEYKGHADSFICSMVPGTPSDQTQYTKGGLLFKLSDSNMQYVTSSSFLLLTYAKYLAFSKRTVSCGGATVTPQRLRAIARRQVRHRHPPCSDTILSELVLPSKRPCMADHIILFAFSVNY